MGAKLKDILIWYRFKPSLSIWFTKSKGKTHSHYLYEETWYGGETFISGVFIFIQLYFTRMHIKFEWWTIVFRRRKSIRVSNFRKHIRYFRKFFQYFFFANGPTVRGYRRYRRLTDIRIRKINIAKEKRKLEEIYDLSKMD